MTVFWRTPLSITLCAALLVPGTAVALEQAELTEMEELLRGLGFNPGIIDGVVDADTIDAIRSYQEFAVLPGAPEPSAQLLDELRGVAAAFDALSKDKSDKVAAEGVPESGLSSPDPTMSPVPEPPQPQPVAEKVIVPPPPPPPKLKPAEAVEPEPERPQVAETPSVAEETETQMQPAEAASQQEATLPASESDIVVETPDPAAEAKARIDAELAPYRQDLQSGALSRADLAKRFNAEGRQALQQARYDEAVLKFSVAIQLDPKFAGAYSNRGAVYQQQEEPDLAAEDFAKAKELGFGGFRIRDGSSPFN